MALASFGLIWRQIVCSAMSPKHPHSVWQLGQRPTLRSAANLTVFPHLHSAHAYPSSKRCSLRVVLASVAVLVIVSASMIWRIVCLSVCL